MPQQLTTSRASRNRRLVAMSIWLGLILAALAMWNGRAEQVAVNYPSETVAFLLAAFTTFVSLFAWMLFNPARGVSAETATLMLAGAATLFPPCVISFCTLPPGSAVAGWLTAGLFILLVIAIMSPVPEEFFGIPRDRDSYAQQVSMIGISDQSVLDLNPDWFQSIDLSTVVSESGRPSLAPSSWRDQEQLLPRTERRRRHRPETSSEDAEDHTETSDNRKGLFRRLQDRAASLRNTSEDSTSTDTGTVERRSTSPLAPAGPKRKSSQRPKPDREPPGPSAKSQAPSMPQADSSPPAPAAPPVRKDRTPEDRSVPTPPQPTDPFATANPAPTETTPTTPKRYTFAQLKDELQVAGQKDQTEFERVTDERGGEMIEGTVVIRFDRGQKRANVHVPFSPPLSGKPDVECSAVDDDSIRLKVPERRAWGLRIEGRRTDTSRPQETEVAFSAVYMPAQ